MKLRNLLSCAAVCLSTVAIASSPEAARTESTRFLEFEDSQIRVLRIHYAPRDRLVTPSPFAPAGHIAGDSDDTPLDTVIVELKAKKRLPARNFKKKNSQWSDATLAMQLATIEAEAMQSASAHQ
jgi:hypothetical protein